ncbi:MAG TPA: undecaprenyldiphospho-muramoylpentapeptide beta-N-acetylglucosaminyltransferase [Thermomicrobiales bacterium]|nr:undecaprenyldiphospho-muramoylpentapeptide beta-N-acetylglucosaminyltransferase [Thermomicrobiales bacterium]
MRLVIAGGGTGGHVGPGLAVVAALRRRVALDLLWLGTRDGVERRLAGEQGIPFRAIQAGKLRRYFSPHTAVDAGRIPLGVLQAAAALRRFQPDVVFGTGGFVSVPAIVAAAALRVPSLIHEQTAQVGLANRINLRFADVLALPYEASRTNLPRTTRRVVVTGNPVRAELLAGDAGAGARRLGLDPAVPTVYVTGGARGAHAVNTAVAALLPDLLDRCQVVHACGPAEANGDCARLSAAAAGWPPASHARYAVREFIGAELPDVYALAALVVGRAGAGTVAELAALGKPAVLIPLPGAGGDEQTRNARLLADAGGAVVLPEADLTPERLRATLADLLADPARLAQMGVAARALARPDAADALADEVLRLAGGRMTNDE